MTAIETRGLTKSYGSRRGIDAVSLNVGPGEIFGFLGPNGAGKSTTIRLLLGFLRASSGEATIFGHNCWQASDRIKQDVGYVAGDVRLYPWLTARRAFRVLGDIRGQNLMGAGLQLADRFELEPDLPVRKMSRGNRQKLALVAALVHRPRLVILDEPTSGLDPLMQETLMTCLREMATDGHTVFFSSHTLSEVETLCDRVAIVRAGQIVADERLANLKAAAPRRATICFSSEAGATSDELPANCEVFRQNGSELDVRFRGPAAEILQWAASRAVADISIGPPNLESLFHSYYRTEETSPSTVSA